MQGKIVYARCSRRPYTWSVYLERQNIRKKEMDVYDGFYSSRESKTDNGLDTVISVAPLRNEVKITLNYSVPACIKYYPDTRCVHASPHPTDPLMERRFAIGRGTVILKLFVRCDHVASRLPRVVQYGTRIHVSYVYRHVVSLPNRHVANAKFRRATTSSSCSRID